MTEPHNFEHRDMLEHDRALERREISKRGTVHDPRICQHCMRELLEERGVCTICRCIQKENGENANEVL